jgi:hypothetical protein
MVTVSVNRRLVVRIEIFDTIGQPHYFVTSSSIENFHCCFTRLVLENSLKEKFYSSDLQ